jgi:DNA anti-recombination protein RmuC
MKKPILLLTMAGVVAASVLSSCQSSSNNIDNQEDKLLKEQVDVVEAKQDLNQALRDSVRQFKMEAQNAITENNRKIDDFKQKIADGNKSAREKYESKISDLESKNKELQKRLDEFNDENGEKWASFKREFNHDMDEVGNSLEDMTKDNVE